MTGSDDIDQTAAEYVIGTLDAGERIAVDARRHREPLLDAAISDWERRLAPLQDTVAPVTPPVDLFQRIEARLDRDAALAPNGSRPVGQTVGGQTVGGQTVGGQTVVGPTVVAALERRLVRWRRVALTASAIAASLALAIGLRATIFSAQPQNFVAVFQKDDAQPAFLLTIDLATRELTIRPVTAAEQPGKTYQLWILAEPLGPAPQSLGLLEASLAPTRKTLSGFEPALLQKATFGISVEPPGGSPTGRPTSPALHGKLHTATP